MQMIVLTLNEALEDLPKRKGISVKSLKTKISEKFSVSENAMRFRINRNIHQALDEKVLVSTKGNGLNGSVRYHSDFVRALERLDDPSDEKELLKILTRYRRSRCYADWWRVA